MSSPAVIKGGRVIDPAQGIDGQRDVRISDGRIQAIEESIEWDEAEVFDASGLIVVPGLVDIHCHFYYGMTSMAADPREIFLPAGVTVAVDAGTSGSSNFLNLRTFIMEPSALHLYAFLNLYVMGMAGGAGDSFRHIKGVRALDMAQVDSAAKIIARNRDRLVGVKFMAPHADRDFFADAAELVSRSREIASISGTRVMIHIDGGTDLATVLNSLAAGDIITHTYHNSEPNILGEGGRLRPEVIDARARNVVFDFAPADHHHFAWSVLEAAVEQGFWPDTISTDVANPVRGESPFATMPDCMSMLLYAGMPLGEVVRASTVGPAAAVGLSDQHGSLEIGRDADVTLLELVDAPKTFKSMEDGGERTVESRLIPVATMVRGEWAWQRSTEQASVPA